MKFVHQIVLLDDEVQYSVGHDLMGPAPPLAAYLQKLSIIEMRFDSMA